MCRLILVHDDFPNQTQTYKSVGCGWPLVLSSLKSLLETGEPLSVSREYARLARAQMHSRWQDGDAQKFDGALAQRVYTSRLLGQDHALVLHGGGNTSV